MCPILILILILTVTGLFIYVLFSQGKTNVNVKGVSYYISIQINFINIFI